MARQTQNTIVGVFESHERAREAVRALKAAGFTDDQIGVASSNQSDVHTVRDNDSDESYAGEGALTGVATGAGLGALWGLGILAGVLPAIGPAIAGGTLGLMLSSAAAGAAAAGLAGSLIGMGMSKEEAEFYESEVKSGRTIVTVNPDTRRNEALSIMKQFGAYDMSSRMNTASSTDHMSAMRSTSSAAAAETCTPCDTRPAAQSTHNSSEQTVRAHEEKVKVHKTPVQTGEVNVRKEVHTEHKTIDVPVTREEIVIERHAVGNQPVSGADFKAGKQEIRIPVKEEQVSIEKQTVVSEEVSVGKRKVQGTERVEADIRKEEIKIDKSGNADVRDDRRKK